MGVRSNRRALIAGAMLLGLGVLATCTPASEELPRDVLGRWVTTESRYADRYFELEADRIRMGTGANSSEVYLITHVSAESHPRGRLYRVTYSVEESEVLFAFHFDAAAGSIRLMNQAGFEWTRQVRP